MTYPPQLRYTKDHVWVQISDGHGNVGVTEYALTQLGAVVYVDLPEAGARLIEGQPFGTIESTDAFKELCSPLTGEVVRVNTALAKTPEAVHADPHTNWLIVLKVRETAEPARPRAALLDASEYVRLVEEGRAAGQRFTGPTE
jgi:glycine cleavage system H protein